MKESLYVGTIHLTLVDVSEANAQESLKRLFNDLLDEKPWLIGYKLQDVRSDEMPVVRLTEGEAQ